MTAHPIPDAALDQPSAIKTRVRKGPLAAPRLCAHCGEMFAPHRKRDEARFCSPRCNWAANKGPEYNAAIARATVAERADGLRDMGECATYRKVGGRHEHRTAAECMIGRPLARGEIVHHKDGNKRNNDPGNLEIMSQAEHASLHFRGKRHNAEHVAKRVASRAITMSRRRASR